MPDEPLYSLLPAFYRNRDALQGYPLRALLGVAETQYAALRRDIQALYDAWFVETCPEWLLPYHAELVGVEGMDDPARVFPATRSAVANAVGYARRKGTAWVLARALRDATGWPARVVEPLAAVGSTQALADVRPGRGGTATLRRGPGAARPQTPARTADVRIPRAPREEAGAGPDGRYGADRMAVCLWRLASYPVTRADAWPAGPGWTFHPGGVDTPLFHPPATLPPLSAGPVPLPVPAPLSREDLRGALAAAVRAPGADPLPLAVWLDREGEPLRPDEMEVADLSRWPAGDAPAPPGVRVRIDPERGRLAVVGAPAAHVRVSYAYGFSADLGGGPYDRRDSLTPADAVEWTATVAARGGPRVDFTTLREALAAWAAYTAGRPPGAAPPTGLIRVLDSARYAETVVIPPVAGQSLAIEAANGQRPTVDGDLSMAKLPPGRITLNGMYLAGRLSLSGKPVVALCHCTLRAPRRDPVPGIARLAAPGTRREELDAPILTLLLDHCVSDALCFPDTLTELHAADSILQGEPFAVASAEEDGFGPYSCFERCTVLGQVRVAAVKAVDTLFAGGVVARDRDVGRLVCCFVGPRSRTPVMEACQPPDGAPDVRPVFVSTRYGAPGFAQLSTATPMAVRAGATDGSEMGAFALLRNAQREANLRAALDEYLPAGMRAAVLYAT